MEFLSAHIEAVFAMFGALFGSSVGVISTLRIHDYRIKALEKHAEDKDIHYHRRDGDPTGLWPKMGGNQ